MYRLLQSISPSNNNKQYSLVALDMDGTVLTEDKHISSGAIEAIAQIQKNGIKVILCTGRAWATAVPYVNKLKIDPSLPLISLGGSLVKIPSTGEILFQNFIPNDIACSLGKKIHEMGITLIIYYGDTLVSPVYNKDTDYYSKRIGLPIRVEPDYITFLSTKPVNKFAVCSSSRQMDELEEYFSKHPFPNIFFYRANTKLIEFENQFSSKHHSLNIVSKALKIPMSDTVAIGDNHNDLGMITQAGLGVAMGNASDNLKKSADYVTYSNEQGGVAHALQCLFPQCFN